MVTFGIMTTVAGAMFALGVAHTLFGLARFMQVFAAAAGSGWIGQFQGVP